MPPYDAHCPGDRDDGNLGSDSDESTTSEYSHSSNDHTVTYIKIESDLESSLDSLSDSSSSSSDSEDETNEPQTRPVPVSKKKEHTKRESPVLGIGNEESEEPTQLRRDHLQLWNELCQLRKQIKGVTQDRHDAEAMLEDKMREVDELKKHIWNMGRSLSSTKIGSLEWDVSSTSQKANDKRDPETGTASQIRKLKAALETKEKVHRDQVRQLTKQLEKKEDQYVAQLRELRLNNRLAPGFSHSVSSSHDCTPLREQPSSRQQAKDDKVQETKSDREIARLNALFQEKEKQYQQQLRQLTKQLEQKEDQYVARLRELRFSKNPVPDINIPKTDLAAEYQAKENAYLERIGQLSEKHAAREDHLKEGLAALSSALYRKESEHQKHINQVKAERQKVQERCNNLQAELDGAITSFSKEVSELKSRDPFEPVRKSDAEVEACWKELGSRVRHFVETHCLSMIPHPTAKELYEKKLLPGIQTICADPLAVLANPRLYSSLSQGLMWEMLWVFVFSSRAEGWAGKTGQDFGEVYERVSSGYFLN